MLKGISSQVGSRAVNARGIQVESGRDDQETIIDVSGWPNRHAIWQVSTVDGRGIGKKVSRRRLGRRSRAQKGRYLGAFGYHDFKQNVYVGGIELHVDSKQGLFVKQVTIEPGVITREQAEIRRRLIACAAEIAVELTKIGIGRGDLYWEVDSKVAGQVCQVHQGFASVPRGQQPRGKRTLLKRPRPGSS